MGLKGIHLILITLAFALSLGFGVWSLANQYGAMGWLSLALGAAVLVYAVDFIRRFKII